LLAEWKTELGLLPPGQQKLDRRCRIEAALDRGHGESLLGDFRVAEIVEIALLHFDSQRYRLHAWGIMPNHVHVVATPLPSRSLSTVVHGGSRSPPRFAIEYSVARAFSGWRNISTA
jgi:hypothetical protein